MVYNPELVKQLLGEKLAELFDGTIEIEKCNDEKVGDFIVGDKLIFKLKETSDAPALRQFIITGK